MKFIRLTNPNETNKSPNVYVAAHRVTAIFTHRTGQTEVHLDTQEACCVVVCDETPEQVIRLLEEAIR